MKTDDIDKKIGMPNVDEEWVRFEREVIRKTPKSKARTIAAWGIGVSVAASIVLFIMFNLHTDPAIDLKPVNDKSKGLIAGLDSISENKLCTVANFVGSDAVGQLKFIANHTDGKEIAKQMNIQADSATEIWPRMAFYHKEISRLLNPKHISFGIGCEPSQSNEWILYYDSVKNTLVYKKSNKNIWQATRESVYQEDKETGRWTPRKKPQRIKGVKVETFSLPVTSQQAKSLKTMWMDAVICAKNQKAIILNNKIYEFPLGELRTNIPNKMHPIIKFNNELMEAICFKNTDQKDSLLNDSTLKKCLSDMKEAMKPLTLKYDSLILIVNKLEQPDSLCKLISNRPKQYFHQKGLMVDYISLWSAYGAKFYSGYNKECPILELTTTTDTLCDSYVNQHPELKQSLYHISGFVYDEKNKPITDAWVGIYGAGIGAPTDSDGHFSFWMPHINKTLYVECGGSKKIEGIQPTDTTIIINISKTQAPMQ